MNNLDARLWKLRDDADKRVSAMMNDRLEWEGYWRELQQQFAPRRGRFSAYEKAKRDTRRRNSKPRQIPDDFASGIKSGLTSPSRPWFTLSLFDINLMTFERVKAWLSEAETILQGLMLRTNLYDQLFDIYKEQGIFGTAALYIDEDDENVFYARSHTIGTYAIGTDEKGVVNRFARVLTFTARQLADRFGEDTLPQSIRLTLRDADNNTRHEVRHLVEPNSDFTAAEQGKRGMKFRSLWWLAGETDPPFLRDSGYHEFPVMAPRWRTVGDDLYGSEQPGDVGLDDAKTIQELETDERSAIKKAVRPPMLVPENAFDGRLNAEPSGVTVYRPSPTGATPAFTPLYNVNFDYQAAAAKRQELIARLEETFFVNFFRMWTSDLRSGRTATEIQAREAEKMYMLGPLIERQMSEMLDPLITRIFAICNRRGMFPPVPPELDGTDLRIEYTSVLANVQKQSAQAGIEIVVASAGQLAQLQALKGEPPSVLDKIDCDEIIERLADMHAIPAGIVLGNDAVAAVREDRAIKLQEQQEQMQQQQALMQGAQAAPQLAGAAKDLSQTEMGGQNALEAMAGMMQGGVPQ